MKLVYLSHCYSGDPANLDRAKRWFRWAWLTHPDTGFVADWILACEVLGESPELRARGLAFDAELIALVDALWLVGGHVSPGMAHERDAAVRAGIPVRDFTALGPEPPDILPAQGST